MLWNECVFERNNTERSASQVRDILAMLPGDQEQNDTDGLEVFQWCCFDIRGN